MIAIVGWIGSVLCVSSVIQKNQMRLRSLNLAACVAMIVFNIANATWSMVLLNVVIAIINIRQIFALRSAANVAGVSESETSVISAPQRSPESTRGLASVSAAAPVIDRSTRELVAA